MTEAISIGSPTKSRSERMLDGVEKVGNKVPHPVIMFLYLIAFIAVLSTILAALDVGVTETVAVPVPTQVLQDLSEQLGGSIVAHDIVTDQTFPIPEYILQEQTFNVQSLLSEEGIRFMLSSFVNNFAGFAVVAVTFVAMMGVGVAEKAGMMGALIRKLVAAAPAALIGFFIIFVGVLSSVASDAGYLILIPLAAAAFASLGRHPLAGLGRRLRRRGLHLRRQHPDHAGRQHAHGDHQRGDRADRRRDADRYRQLLLLGRLVDPDGDRRLRGDERGSSSPGSARTTPHQGDPGVPGEQRGSSTRRPPRPSPRASGTRSSDCW